MARQTAFQVGGFVAVDVAALGQTVNHADNLRQESRCLFFVFQIAEVFDGRAGRLLVVAVLQATLFYLADALERGTMVCHDLMLQQSLIAFDVQKLDKK